MKLVCNKIEGFHGTDVEIYHEGKPFYFFEGETFFNLPKGTFESVGRVEQLKNRIVYDTPSLSKPEKFIKMKGIKIHVEENPNKASIDVNTGNVYFDEDLNNKLYVPNKVFVLGHELGHNYYKDECKCDFFSAKKMLDNGFNPSQCYHSTSVCLGQRNEERKEKLLNFLRQTTWR